MDQNLIVGAVGAVLLGLAVAMYRKPGDGAVLSAPADISDVYAEWQEPDQNSSVLETIWTYADPGTYAPANVTQDTAAANAAAFLQMIRYAEGTAGPNGYRTLFGGALFDSYADHPRIYVPFRNTSSSAAGAFQILYRTWAELKAKLGLQDFSPASQNAAALELIRQRGALNDVYAGRIQQAIAKVAKVWASLPGAGYNQPERKLSALLSAYADAGGNFEGIA
jgi:muramidase (phage lysozyme)